MKYLLTILSFLILSSCLKEEPYLLEKHSLHITNYTNIPVEMTFYFDYDTSLLKTYKIKAKESRYFDSIVFKLTQDQYDFIYNVEEGTNYFPMDEYLPQGPIWEKRSYVQYKYGAFKQSVLLNTNSKLYCRDTLTMYKPCNSYISIARNTNDEKSPTKYISKYYISNQQYLLADSL